jgi:hypothetical protein
VEPDRPDDDAVVDLVDALLERGVILDADVVITVADVPLVGLKLRAAVAGMTTMTDYGLFEAWDRQIREASDRTSRGDESSLDGAE